VPIRLHHSIQQTVLSQLWITPTQTIKTESLVDSGPATIHFI
jgi:hypothetical protein